MEIKVSNADNCIDLRSDTVTKPSPEMMAAIMKASMGDHGYGEDESTLMLESYCAQLFQKESALFINSGTMSNQIALRCYTQPGDEIILDESYHINYFEAGPSTDLGKVYLNLTHSVDGILRVENIEKALANKSRSEVGNKATLICLENSINTFGGKIYPLAEMQQTWEFSRKYHLYIHLDGARLLNSCVATGIQPSKYASYTDSLTLCFSKGLGAPFGSILVGTNEFIKKAKKYLKWYGGGLHQSGLMASAALYAIQNNVDRLAEDHENAKLLAILLNEINGIEINLNSIETNIVMINLRKLGMKAEEFRQLAKTYGILLYPWSKEIVRAVTHLGITQNDIKEAVKRINKLSKKLIPKNTSNVLYS